jgi:predicted Zn-dependent peptidase
MIYERELFELENGLRVIFDHRPNSQTFAACCMVNVGSLNDYKKQYGMAHLLEHFLFRSKLEGSDESVEERLYTHGGTVNAETSTTYTSYFLNSHKDDALKAIQYIGRVICDLSLDEEIFSQEKEVVHEEIGDWNLFSKNLWDSSKLSILGIPKKYHYPVIGSNQSLEKIGIRDLINFYEKHYTPENIVLSVVGNFEKDKMKDQINKYFLNLPKTRSKKLKRVRFRIEGPKIESGYDFSAHYFDIYFITNAYQTPDLPVAELMDEYFDFIIHKNYRLDKEQLYHLYCKLDFNYNIGCFDFGFFCKHKKIKRVLFDFIKDIKKLKTHLIDEEILKTIKDKHIKNNLILFEDVLSAAKWYSQRELLTSKSNPNDFQNYIESLKLVDTQAFKDFSNELFILENFFLEYTGYLTFKNKLEILDILE